MVIAEPSPPPGHIVKFPADFDESRGEFLMLPLASDRIADAAFLDQRLGVDWSAAERLHWREVESSADPPRAALLFHTAFCCSTLLARSLQLPPRLVALREPLALSRLATVALKRPSPQIEGPLRAALELLARPSTAGGSVLIKPTNQANNLLCRMLEMTRGRAILLYSSLPEFVISCCKKLPEADRRIRWMAQHLIKDTRLQAALQIPWDHHFHFIEACVLTWYAQIERYTDALAADACDRLRSLDMQALLYEPQAAVAAAANWLQFDIDASVLQARVLVEFRRNAKHPHRAFNAALRAQGIKEAMARYADVLGSALTWARDSVAPFASEPADWKSLVPASHS
ncbi:MAG: hypothetical protein JSR26_11010 [Proteobacteria bacterium]|nr:hypothetical protein [Pseudomonadota bacterium]